MDENPAAVISPYLDAFNQNFFIFQKLVPLAYIFITQFNEIEPARPAGAPDEPGVQAFGLVTPGFKQFDEAQDDLVGTEWPGGMASVGSRKKVMPEAETPGFSMDQHYCDTETHNGGECDVLAAGAGQAWFDKELYWFLIQLSKPEKLPELILIEFYVPTAKICL
jgi:hypothetical protein